MDREESLHIPVMVSEFLDFFRESKLTTFFDATVGAGGHAEALLTAHPEIDHYWGFDRDREAVEIATRRLAPWRSKVEIVQGNFADFDHFLKSRGVEQVDGFFLI